MELEVYQILLIVLAGIVGIYLLVLICDLIFVFSFRRILKKHDKSLSIVLAVKFENVKKLFEIMKNLDVEIEEQVLNNLYSIDISSFENQASPTCKKARERLSFLRDHAMFIASSNPALNKHHEFALAKQNVLENDEVYRIKLAMYNADVLGYNYWIRFLPTRFIFLMFRVKQKELIQ